MAGGHSRMVHGAAEAGNLDTQRKRALREREKRGVKEEGSIRGERRLTFHLVAAKSGRGSER